MSLQSLISEIDKDWKDSDVCKRLKDCELTAINHGFPEWHGQTVQDWWMAKLKQVLEEIIKAAPEEKKLFSPYEIGFNQGRAQTLQIIEDWLKGEEV